jgi:hypothetical protein
MHALELTENMKGRRKSRFTNRRGRTKLSDVHISAGFRRCVHFQKQRYDIAFEHQNSVVEMHIICTNIFITSSSVSRALFWTTCRHYNLLFVMKAPAGVA